MSISFKPRKGLRKGKDLAKERKGPYKGKDLAKARKGPCKGKDLARASHSESMLPQPGSSQVSKWGFINQHCNGDRLEDSF